MNLPRRPRAHVLETEARLALRRSLPREWVVRDVSPDYGLDEEVEIFESEMATGLVFGVQLKATDLELRGGVQTIVIDPAHANYWREHSLRVLLVGYHAPTDALRGRWFHRLRDLRPDENFRLRLSEADLLSAGINQEISGELRLLRRLHSPNPAWPMRVGIRVDPQPTPSLIVERTLLQLRSILGGEPSFVFSRDSAAEVELHVSSEALIVTAGDVSITAHGGRDASNVGADGAIALAITMTQLGHHSVAVRIAARASSNGTLIFNQQILAALAPALQSSGALADVLTIVENIERRADDLLPRFLAMSIFLTIGQRLSRDERIESVRFMRNRANRIGQSAGSVDEARARYSLATWLQGVAEHHDSLNELEVALDLDPLYAGRPWFCQAIAASNFTVGQYEKAVRWYEAALECGADRGAVARLGDAYQRSGSFSKSRDAFLRYKERSDGAHEPFWCLMSYAADWYIQARNLADGFIRDLDGSRAAFNKWETSSNPTDLIYSLNLDPLNAVAWHEVAKYINNQEAQPTSAAWPFMIGCVLAGTAETWVDTLLIWLTCRAPFITDEVRAHILSDLVEAGYEKFGETYLTAVMTRIESLPQALSDGLTLWVSETTMRMRTKAPQARIVGDHEWVGTTFG